MNILVDAFGGDNSPFEIVSGVVDALNESKNIFKIILLGDENILKDLLSKYQYPSDRLEIFDSKEVITNDDSPVDAIRNKKNSSLVVGLKYLNSEKEADAFISAGSTGAVLAGAVLLLKRINGINRPALAPLLPTSETNYVVLIDCGANSECKPEMLHQFAKMGEAYAKVALSLIHPRIGLLNNGVEEKKGNELTQATYKLLREDSNINFIGNAEGRDILSGNFDVIVSDGFSGNIALKSCEGTALMMFSQIKNGIKKGGIRAKIGYLLLKPVFKKLKETADYSSKGGAVLLGLQKLVIKVHGSAKSKTIKAAIFQAASLVDKNLVSKITDSIKITE
ncbi:MAG: Phosphate acyltransferase [Firmicutes bacterium ADurb.Bin080]|jgi:phosphate acyltransferase|nr:phosphate acyltransferase PlsX [Clostridiales bacterium]OQC12677.1 MAG: Phosphate acyltransferase [Firmicutes bacterium ADurb.Bin080]